MKTGWLSPNGDFYPCDTYEHVDVAEYIVDKLNLQRGGQHHKDEVLLDAGWVQISRSALGQKEQKIYWRHFLTDYQKNFLRPYFEENDEIVCPISLMRWEREIER